MQPPANRSGSAILDGTPPSPTDRIYSKPTKSGDDTASLYGEDDTDEGSGGVTSSPGNRLLLSVQMFMSATNLMESVKPGSVPDPIKQWIAQQMQTAPQAAEQMSRQGNPAALLAAVGSSANSGSSAPSSPSPMAATGMGMGGRNTAQPPM